MNNTKFVSISTGNEIMLNKGDRIETVKYERESSFNGNLVDKVVSRIKETLSHVNKKIDYLVIYVQNEELIKFLTVRPKICAIVGVNCKIKYIGYQEDTYQDPIKTAMNDMAENNCSTSMIINEILTTKNVHLSIIELVDEDVTLEYGRYKTSSNKNVI